MLGVTAAAFLLAKPALADIRFVEMVSLGAQTPRARQPTLQPQAERTSQLMLPGRPVAVRPSADYDATPPEPSEPAVELGVAAEAPPKDAPVGAMHADDRTQDPPCICLIHLLMIDSEVMQGRFDIRI